MSKQINQSIIKFSNKVKGLFNGGFFHILSGNVLNKAITMISSIIIARLVDKTQYAYLSYADNLYSYITLISGLGLATALLKFCGKNVPVEKNKAYVEYALKKGVLFDFAISVLLCIAVSFVHIPYPQARFFVWGLALYPSLSNVYNTFSIFVRTQLENRLYAAGGVIYSLSTCLFSIVLLILLNVKGLIVARYVAVLIVILYLGAFIHRKLDKSDAAKLDLSEKKAFFSMAISLMLANLFSGMMSINEAFLVNHLIRDEIVTANFKVASLFPQMMSLVGGAIAIYFFPLIAQMSEWIQIKRKVIQIGIMSFFLLLCVALIGMLVTPFAITLLYGEKYSDAIPISYLLWAMNAANSCLRTIPINMLPAIGRTKFNAIVTAISCIVQVGIDYILILRLGIMGVAWGSIVVYSLSGLAFWIYFIHECNKEIKVKSVDKY